MDFASRLEKFLKRSSEFIKSCFFVFGCFPRVLIILGLFLLSGLSLKVLQFSWNWRDLMQFLHGFREKSANIRFGFWFKSSVLQLNGLKNGCSFNKFKLGAKSKRAVDTDCDVKSEEKDGVSEEDVQNEGKECNPEDGEFDVIELRKLVKIERKYKDEALTELEKERMAAATAAKEALAMIFRLQNEKSAVEIEANQFRRMAEQKHQYDLEVIEYLQRIVMEIESERSLSE